MSPRLLDARWMLLFSLAACQASPSAGAACTRGSDCTSPLACRLGRCRLACAENRDCGAGQLCLLDATGAGACGVDQDVCAGACIESLVCRDAVCVQGCTIDADCPRDGHCGGGVCIAGASDAGLVVDAGPSDAGIRGCTADRDCLASEACDLNPSAGNLAYQVCRARCMHSTDCPSGSACIAADYRVDAGAGPLGICTPVCDPATGSGCPAGTTCATVHDNDIEGTTQTWAECVLPGADAEGCTACEVWSCGMDMSCRNLSPSVSLCSRSCVVGSHECPGGAACEADQPMYIANGVTWGYCPAAPITCP